MTKYYKVLVNGRSCNGGDAEWALPKQREDGTWEPGDWMPEIQGQLMLCVNGYHLTTDPARWWQDGAECYVAEWDGEHVGDGDGGDTIAVRRCRLLRKLSNGELAALRIFADGRHVVTGGFTVASGFATVEASGSAKVEAYGSAKVEASGSAQVWASDSATVEAHDFATVEAYGSAKVEAYDFATVEAYGSATVEAYGSATVKAYGSATVKAYGSAKVEASGSATVEAHSSATVEVSGFATVKARGSATVKAYDSATVTTVWGQPTVTVEERAVWIDRRKVTPVIHVIDGKLVHAEA